MMLLHWLAASGQVTAVPVQLVPEPKQTSHSRPDPREGKTQGSIWVQFLPALGLEEWLALIQSPSAPPSIWGWEFVTPNSGLPVSTG